jgi:hypothetical protein
MAAVRAYSANSKKRRSVTGPRSPAITASSCRRAQRLLAHFADDFGGNVRILPPIKTDVKRTQQKLLEDFGSGV